MTTTLIVVVTVIPLAGLALYLVLLLWAAREDGRRQEALEEWQREHQPQLLQERLDERPAPLPPRRPRRPGASARRR